MVAVVEDGATATEGAVDRPGNPDRDAADTAGQTFATVGLHEEMHVIVLDGEMDDPEAVARGRSHRTQHRGEGAAGPEAPNGRRSPQSSVDRMCRKVRRARTMRDTGPSTRRRLATGAGSTTAPSRGEGERKLHVASGHLIRRKCKLTNSVSQALRDCVRDVPRGAG